MTPGSFTVEFNRPTGWHHYVLNYIGPEDLQGIRLYQDGVHTEGANPSWNKYPDTYEKAQSEEETGTVAGKLYNDGDDRRASGDLDELIFFNSTLSESQITSLYGLYD